MITKLRSIGNTKGSHQKTENKRKQKQRKQTIQKLKKATNQRRNTRHMRNTRDAELTLGNRTDKLTKSKRKTPALINN